MKRFILMICFLIMAASSYSEVASNRDEVIILTEYPGETFQMSIPKADREHSKDPVVVTFSRVHTDIYPTEDKIRLLNDRNEEMILEFDRDITWVSDGENSALFLRSRRDKKAISEFLSRSSRVDFYLYRTNILYEVRGISVEKFKSHYSRS